jgi:hypothetical protein
MRSIIGKVLAGLAVVGSAVSVYAAPLAEFDWGTATADVTSAVEGGMPLALGIFTTLMGLAIVFAVIKKARSGGK